MFLCGFKRFGHQDKAKRSSKRSKSSRQDHKIKKNPYAEVGIDKFHALLAEIDEKKEMIYEEMGSENISLIRFVYSQDDHVKPIVVKVKNKNIDDKFLIMKRVIPKRSIALTNSTELDDKSVDESFRVDMNYYRIFHVMLVFILLFLAIYGPFFAIICTSIACYFVPGYLVEEASSSSSSTRMKTKRKTDDYVTQQ